MKHTPATLIAVDDSRLLDLIGGGGIEAMLAAREYGRRIHRRRDAGVLYEMFEERFGYPFRRLVFSIGPTCGCGVSHEAEPADRGEA